MSCAGVLVLTRRVSVVWMSPKGQWRCVATAPAGACMAGQRSQCHWRGFVGVRVPLVWPPGVLVLWVTCVPRRL